MKPPMDHRLMATDLPGQLLELMAEVGRLEKEWDRLQASIDLKNELLDRQGDEIRELRGEARRDQLRADLAQVELRQAEEEIAKLKAENKWLNAYTGPALHLLETLADWSTFELRNQFLTGFALPCSPEMAGKWRALQDAVIAVARQYELEEVA